MLVVLEVMWLAITSWNPRAALTEELVTMYPTFLILIQSVEFILLLYSEEFSMRILDSVVEGERNSQAAAIGCVPEFDVT